MRIEFKGNEPFYAHSTDAGGDLTSDRTDTIMPGESATFGTGTYINLPHGYVGLVFGRSGLGINHGIRLSNSVGVIDSGYTGEIMVRLHNDSTEPYTVLEAQRIAQLVVVPICTPMWEQVEEFDPTERGDNGFGSSGEK